MRVPLNCCLTLLSRLGQRAEHSSEGRGEVDRHRRRLGHVLINSRLPLRRQSGHSAKRSQCLPMGHLRRSGWADLMSAIAPIATTKADGCGDVGADDGSATNSGYHHGTRDDFTSLCKAAVAVAAVPDAPWRIGRAPAQGFPWAKISEWRFPSNRKRSNIAPPAITTDRPSPFA